MTEQLQRESRARIRAETNGNPSWTDLGDGLFALHIQYGGNAVVVNVGSGEGDQAAFREWLESHWPSNVAEEGWWHPIQCANDHDEGGNCLDVQGAIVGWRDRFRLTVTTSVTVSPVLRSRI